MTRDHLQRLSIDSLRSPDLVAWDNPDSNWNRAALHGNQADPFCCGTDWQVAFHETRCPEREVIVRECLGSVLAFAKLTGPLVETLAAFGADDHVFGPLESGWMFGCPLLGPDGLGLFEELLADWGATATKRKSLFLVSGLVNDSSMLRRFTDRLQPEFGIWKVEGAVLCNASLDGGVDGFLSRRSAKYRANLRRQSRRAANDGVSFERIVPGDPGEVKALFERMLAVEAASWKGADDVGMTADTSGGFYLRLLTRLAGSARVRCVLARHRGRDIGYIFGGLIGNIYRGQQFSFVEDWRAHSIGNLLQLEMIRWLCEDGVVRYDMGPATGPRMGYKRHWAENRREIITALVQRK